MSAQGKVQTGLRFWRSWIRLLAETWRSSPRMAALTALVSLAVTVQPAVRFYAFAGLVDALAGAVGSQRAVDGRSAAVWLVALTASLAVQNLGFRALAQLRTRLHADLEMALTERLLAKAGRTPLLAFESPDFFDRYSRARNGVHQNLNQLLTATELVIRHGMAFLTTLAVMASLHPGAAALLLLAGAPTYLVQARMANAYNAMYRNQAERERRAGYVAGLLLQRSLAQEVRLFGLSREIWKRWREVTDGLVAQRLSFVLKRGASQILTGSLGGLTFVGALTLLGTSAMAGRLSVGALAAAIEAAHNLQERMIVTLVNAGELYQHSGFVAEVWDFLDDRGPELPAALPPSGSNRPGASAVTFKGVSFTYPGAVRPTLESVSFQVRPGDMIALVGENGAGKSTLVKLLLGLYPPSAGRVVVDGADMSSAEGARVGARIAPVFQDFLRYSLTAGENVGVGEVTALADQPRVARAAAASGAGPVIESLPAGYDTQLGKEFDGGQELSGGQWQKLSIGRAYMREASLLVLDEPTAALDPLAEVEVFRRFRELARGRTAFFISHRLGAARLADRILVLRHGKLVEVGHHDELMALNGEYAELFRAQSHLYGLAAHPVGAS